MPTLTSSISASFQGIRQRVPAAITRALNRSIASARTAMVAVIAPDIGLKSGDVRDRLRIQEATNDRAVARLYASSKRIPVIDFNAKASKRGGVTARLPGSPYRRAFIATMGTGHRGVFERKGKPRLPIRELFGPSIVHVFSKFQHVGLERGREQLEKNLKSEFRYALSKS